jgi:C4-dicarboxylate-specific signal transduction histidine kinase
VRQERARRQRFRASGLTAPAARPDEPSPLEVRNEGDDVIVEVSDSGPGVPPADRERTFEPFNSTKEIGVGTGLGLFVCRNASSGRATRIGPSTSRSTS